MNIDFRKSMETTTITEECNDKRLNNSCNTYKWAHGDNSFEGFPCLECPVYLKNKEFYITENETKSFYCSAKITLERKEEDDR
jgi:hypothetical protein